jgi:hypothetical protein
MSTWSLSVLLAGLHDDIERRLSTARQAFAHSPTKGDASEHVWLQLFQEYLPRRYQAEKAHVVDSNGKFSDQIDVVVFDRQYSPLIFKYEGQTIIPAESVYAVFEAKQTIDAALIAYAQNKVQTVRALHRTSLSITHAAGVSPPRALTHVIGGILALDSEWSPPLGEPLKTALAKNLEGRLDLGCVAAHGIFTSKPDGSLSITPQGKPATALLLEFIAQLQTLGTVPMIDTRAYARWLTT